MKLSFEGSVEDVVHEMVVCVASFGGGKLSTTQRREGDAEPSRRRGTNTKEAPTETGSPVLSDRDISKAASEAATKLTPARVQEVITSYSVKTVGELDQDQRRKFIDQLEEEVSNG